MVTFHDEIEHLRLPERYLAGELPPELSAAFSDHALECEECWDRLQLAQIWRKTQQTARRQSTQTAFDDEPAVFEAPYLEDPENGYFEDSQFYGVHVTEAAEVAYTNASPNGALRNGASANTTALVPAFARPWQVPTLTRLAAVLAVALEYIHHQQVEIERLTRENGSPEMNALGRFISQFEPWHLVLLGALTALLLLLMPTTYLLYEFRHAR